MNSYVAVRISDSLHLHISEVGGSHRVALVTETQEEIAVIQVSDLQRLLKRPGTIIASAPVELRNEQRQIIVRLRGRIVGQVEKHQIVAALP
jgi:hypothetical protein